MSYDLAAWLEPKVIQPEEAGAKYQSLFQSGSGDPTPSQKMTRFIDDVADEFRKANPSQGDPWAAPPEVGQDYALMPIRRAVVSQVLPVVAEVSLRHDLTWYDPQEGRLYQDNSQGELTLQFSDGSTVVNPDSEAVRLALFSLTTDDWFAILRRGPQYYIQVGYGSEAGVGPEEYALELREGSAARHWRRAPVDLGAVVSAFLSFRAGDSSWRQQNDWAKLDF